MPVSDSAQGVAIDCEVIDRRTVGKARLHDRKLPARDVLFDSPAVYSVTVVVDAHYPRAIVMFLRRTHRQSDQIAAVFFVSADLGVEISRHPVVDDALPSQIECPVRSPQRVDPRVPQMREKTIIGHEKEFVR